MKKIQAISYLFLFLTCLPLSLWAETPSTAPSHWQVQGDVIRDSKTSLMWTKGDFRTLQGRFTHSWDEAMQWAKDMNANKYAGYQDWQVASIPEYRTLRQAGWRDVFDSNHEDFYWSRKEINRHVASYISFDEGYAVSGAKSGQRWSAGPREGELMNFSARLVRKAAK